jgi:hypothetical protein
VIELLNSYFVPVYTSNDSITAARDQLTKEKSERERVYRAFLEAKMSAGSVHVYVLSPDAVPLGSIHVAHAGDKDASTGKDRTQVLLEKTIRELGTPKGPTLISPRPQSKPSAAPTDALVLHLTARKLTEKGSWNEFPAEDLIVLPASQWQNLLPSSPLTVGASWTIDHQAITPILTRFFPQTECCTAHDEELLSAAGTNKHRLEEGSLHGMILSTESDKVMVRLDGNSKVLHQFYPNHNYPPTVSTAKIVGYMILNQSARKIDSFSLISDGGRFEKMDMGVAVRSVP